MNWTMFPNAAASSAASMTWGVSLILFGSIWLKTRVCSGYPFAGITQSHRCSSWHTRCLSLNRALSVSSRSNDTRFSSLLKSITIFEFSLSYCRLNDLSRYWRLCIKLIWASPKAFEEDIISSWKAPRKTVSCSNAACNSLSCAFWAFIFAFRNCTSCCFLLIASVFFRCSLMFFWSCRFSRRHTLIFSFIPFSNSFAARKLFLQSSQ